MGLVPGLGRSPGVGSGNPGKFHGQRSLGGCSPWGCKESDTTERLSTTHTRDLASGETSFIQYTINYLVSSLLRDIFQIKSFYSSFCSIVAKCM